MHQIALERFFSLAPLEKPKPKYERSEEEIRRRRDEHERNLGVSLELGQAHAHRGLGRIRVQALHVTLVHFTQLAYDHQRARAYRHKWNDRVKAQVDPVPSVRQKLLVEGAFDGHTRQNLIARGGLVQRVSLAALKIDKRGGLERKYEMGIYDQH